MNAGAMGPTAAPGSGFQARQSAGRDLTRWSRSAVAPTKEVPLRQRTARATPGERGGLLVGGGVAHAGAVAELRAHPTCAAARRGIAHAGRGRAVFPSVTLRTRGTGFGRASHYFPSTARVRAAQAATGGAGNRHAIRTQGVRGSQDWAAPRRRAKLGPESGLARALRRFSGVASRATRRH